MIHGASFHFPPWYRRTGLKLVVAGLRLQTQQSVLAPHLHNLVSILEHGNDLARLVRQSLEHQFPLHNEVFAVVVIGPHEDESRGNVVLRAPLHRFNARALRAAGCVDDAESLRYTTQKRDHREDGRVFAAGIEKGVPIRWGLLDEFQAVGAVGNYAVNVTDYGFHGTPPGALSEGEALVAEVR